MATRNPISTISYNSEAFLREKLEELYKAHKIQAYQYICHVGEDGDKDHIHVRIEPNTLLDPMKIREKLAEFDPLHPTKPKCVRPWRPSKEEDWFLYAVHDPDYLANKYEQGEKIPYSVDDIKVSEFYDVHVAFQRAKASILHSPQATAKRLREGAKPIDLLMEGESAFTINAVNRLLHENEYAAMASEKARLEDKLSDLIAAIQDAGFSVVAGEDGKIHLEPIEQDKQR